MTILAKIYSKVMSICFYKLTFGHFGNKSRIEFPLQINGRKNIQIGNNVLIKYKTWLACVGLTGEIKPVLRIGNYCVIGNFNHIYATKNIIIEDYVLTADKVYISDCHHYYEKPNIPVIQQPIKQLSSITIGEGSWLGENVCVIGASIGKHCIIGANTVVTKDIPDYSVAVGVPAKIIKKYKFETQLWEKVHNI
jgi:acetyltransferase-like isoleucine patch superfamily enzyme